MAALSPPRLAAAPDKAGYYNNLDLEKQESHLPRLPDSSSGGDAGRLAAATRHWLA